MKPVSSFKHPPPAGALGRLSGKIGDITYLPQATSRRIYGRYVPFPHQHFSDAQIRAKKCLQAAMKSWLFLSPEEKKSFDGYYPDSAFSNNIRARKPGYRRPHNHYARYFSKECFPMVLLSSDIPLSLTVPASTLFYIHGTSKSLFGFNKALINDFQ